MSVRHELRVLYWNCRALATSIPEIDELPIEDADLVFLSETHLKSSSSFYLRNWVVEARMDYPASATQKGGTRGLMLLKRKGFQPAVRHIGGNCVDSYWMFTIGDIHLVHLYAEPKISPDLILGRIDNALAKDYTFSCIFGDWNVDGNKPRHKNSFKRITQSLLLQDFTLHPDVPKITFHAKGGSSCIDHLFVRKDANIYNVKPINMQSSDHVAIGFSIISNTVATPYSFGAKSSRPWNLRRIRDFSLQDKVNLIRKVNTEECISINAIYKEIGTISSSENTQHQIDLAYSLFENLVKDISNRLVGTTNYNSFKRPDFFTNELVTIKKALRMLRKTTKYYVGTPQESLHLGKIQNLYAEYTTKIAARKRDLIVQYYKSISILPINEMLKTAKRAEKNIGLLSPPLSRPTIETLQTYFAEVYKNHAPQTLSSNTKRIKLDLAPIDPFTAEEISKQLAKLANGKAVGPDNIPAELLKLWSPIITPILVLLFNALNSTKRSPNSWKQGLMFPIHKEGKDSALPSSYRPICLLSHVRKLYERCVLKRINTKISLKLGYTQYGFRPNHSTIDAALIVDSILSRGKGQIHAAFLDVKGAYDTVDQNLLWDKLFRLLKDEYGHIIKNLFINNTMLVSINNQTSAPIHLQRGITQGSILAPFLYNIFVNDLAKSCRINNPVRWATNDKKYTLSVIQYADDIVLLAKDSTQLQVLLNKCHQHSVLNNYEYNCAKSVIFSDSSFSLAGQPIPNKDIFNYLGLPFTRRGINNNLFWQNNLLKGEKAVDSFKRLGIVYHVPVITKIRLFKQLIRPKVEYGLSVVTKQRNQTTALDSMLHRIYSFLAGTGCNVSKLGLVHTLGLESIETRRSLLAGKLKVRLLSLDQEGGPNPTKSLAKRILAISPKLSSHSAKINRIILSEEVDKELTTEDQWIKHGFKRLKFPGKERKFLSLWLPQYRYIQLYLLNRLPGAPIQCKQCNAVTHCFVVHAQSCNIDPILLASINNTIKKLKDQIWMNISPDELGQLENKLRCLKWKIEG